MRLLIDQMLDCSLVFERTFVKPLALSCTPTVSRTEKSTRRYVRCHRVSLSGVRCRTGTAHAVDLLVYQEFLKLNALDRPRCHRTLTHTARDSQRTDYGIRVTRTGKKHYHSY